MFGRAKKSWIKRVRDVEKLKTFPKMSFDA